MKDKIKEILITRYYQDIAAIVTFTDGSKINVHKLDSVNREIELLIKQTGQDITSLISKDIFKYDRDQKNIKFIFSKYELKNNRFEERVKVVAEPTVPKEETIVPKEKPIVQNEEPIVPKEEAIVQNEEPIVQKEEPTVQKEEPTVPKEETIVPKEETIVPKEKPIVQNEETTSRKKHPIVKKLVIGALGIAAIAALLHDGYVLIRDRDKTLDNNINPDGKARVESSIEDTNIATTYTNPLLNDPYPEYEQGTPGRSFEDPQYTNYGSIVPEESMSSQLDSILNICYRNISDIGQFVQNGAYLSFDNYNINSDPINLQNIVVSNESDTIRQICSVRNSVVYDAYQYRDIDRTRQQIDSFLIMYGDYVFGNSPVFNGNTVIPYQSLSPYSKYIVNVIGRSMLQTVINYNDLGKTVEGTNYTYLEYSNRLYNDYIALSELLTNADSRTR